MRNGDVDPNIADIVFEVPRSGSGSSGSNTNCRIQCKACTQVSIINDGVLEELYEDFSLVLSHDDPSVHLTSTSATVTIVDDDGRCCSYIQAFLFLVPQSACSAVTIILVIYVRPWSDFFVHVNMPCLS